MSQHYRSGDHGPAVAEIRSKLTRLGLLSPSTDDAFDESVETVVRRFQQERGLTAHGVVDTATYQVLDEARWQLGDRLLSYVVGSPLTGDDIVALQRRLTELGFDVGQVDGIFSSHTEAALREFQRNVGLPADGTCGPSTFKALRRLAPRVTGGRPDSLRAGEALRAAGTQLSGKIVCIDPGHGGDDLGNVAGDVVEAEIVGDVASRIEGRLAAIGVRTFQTRGLAGPARGDIERAEFANQTGANLLVSLHVDVHSNSRASGISTYHYGLDRPGSNSAIGEQFAGLVQRELVARTGMVDCRTHAKTWALLRRSDMAAVRIELGYISNPDDAARLSSPQFRDIITEAVVVAVQRVYLPSHEDAHTGAMRLADLVER